MALESNEPLNGPRASYIYSGRVRATARCEVTWKGKMKRMVRTAWSALTSSCRDSWPTKCEEEVVLSVDFSLGKAGTGC